MEQWLQGLLDPNLSPGLSPSQLAMEPQANVTSSLCAGITAIHLSGGVIESAVLRGTGGSLWRSRPDKCLAHREVLASQRGWCDSVSPFGSGPTFSTKQNRTRIHLPTRLSLGPPLATSADPEQRWHSELQNSTASSAVPRVTVLVPAAGGAHTDVTTCWTWSVTCDLE